MDNTANMTKEQKFYYALQDIFIGAKIEGEGGFVNLMRIKSNYYSKIEELLKKDIDKALQKYPKFREDLFDKLYTFFNRYFTKSGSIYFNYTPLFQNVYDKVYTDDKDVILFWKTRMLYYVKTDRIFNNLEVEFEEKGKKCKFFFDVSKLEHKRANEKRNLIYEFKDIRKDGKIVFEVFYSERGKQTNYDEIKKSLKKENINITDEILERAFSTFEKQSEVDYFINKNAKEFLQEQFKLWLYQYVYSEESQWPKERIDQLQILKDIAYKIIDFIAQFEDELVKIWNKPKFVRNSNYVITLDRIFSACHSERSEESIKLIEKIQKHKGWKEQVKEWKELGILEKEPDDLFENTVNGKHLKKEHQFLPIDTKYFKDLELEILGLFDDLDNSLDGWLIKSENYQALNTILPKFREKVQTIYIDPPFNLDSSDQFLYRTNYKDSNWATLLENRLRIAKDWLNEKGSIFVRCDANGNWIVRFLMNDIFDNKLKNEIAVKRTRTLKGESGRFHTAWESLYFYGKSDNIVFNGFRKLKPESEWQWVEMHLPGTRRDEDLLYRNFFGKKIKAPEGRRWALSQEALDDAISKGLVKMDEKTGMPKFLTKWETLGSNWTDISGYSPTWNFTTENSEELLQRVIESTSNKTDLVFDFFLGSGTTTAVAHKLCRKWIGVEMGEHFYTVVLPRMKKVLAYDKSGISKEVKEYQRGGFFKYYELEQYEVTLRKVKYEDSDLFQFSENPYEQYIFLKDKKLLDALEIDYKNNKVKVDLSKLYPDIDTAETLSNLKGKWIKKLTKEEVEFEDGEKVDLKNLDYKLIKPLIWW
jgi:adenine specific DNA methylase Mod